MLVMQNSGDTYYYEVALTRRTIQPLIEHLEEN